MPRQAAHRPAFLGVSAALKRALWFSLVLPLFASLAVLSVPQPAHAQAGNIAIKNGFNDAWFNPSTPGQGFFITVFPVSGTVFLAWFTYDTERPIGNAPANLGEAGHRWLTAFGPINGSQAELAVEVTSGGVFNSANPQVSQVSGGTITLRFSSCAAGVVEYDMPASGLSGAIPIERISNANVAFCESQQAQSCQAIELDQSHGPNNPPVVNGSIVPLGEFVDGGPGPDGIPAIENPVFTTDFSAILTVPEDLVIGIKEGDDIRAYPLHILWWHEVLNDRFSPSAQFFTVSHCPLTGTSMLWDAIDGVSNPTWGVSGLLWNSNLVMYDRETATLWPQMLEQAGFGPAVTTIPKRRQVVETTWQTWLEMYPDTVVLSQNTGFSRDYRLYPYGSYLWDDRILFPTNNAEDMRLQAKERVVGINVGSHSRVYPISGFDSGVEVINDTVGGMPVVVAGSSDANFGVIYYRHLPDCSVAEFEAVQGRLPVIMQDGRGNEWDVLGNAVSGPDAGARLLKTNSYVSYWFAWTAFFPEVEIRQ